MEKEEKKVLNEKVNLLVKDLSSIRKTMESIGVVKSILKREIKAFGNGCHIILPKEYLNKKAKVIIS